MRAVRLAAVCAVTLVAAGCGRSGQESSPPPRWVQRANAFCTVEDRKIKRQDPNFDSAAEIADLEHEGRGLARLGVFNRIPAAGEDVVKAFDILVHTNGGDFPDLRRADRALIRARRTAARRGVHCSFAAFPLVNL